VPDSDFMTLMDTIPVCYGTVAEYVWNLVMVFGRLKPDYD